MSDVEKRTVERLLEKSKEAFLLAIELYNRPTIKYHVEGCAFFLCNAWELMLKAHLIKRNGLKSIYYPASDRTISLEDCLSRIYTNVHDPLRANMHKAIDLRNTSTHFVVLEYEYFYGPILQACVENFDAQMRKLHDIEISDSIPENYLVLSVRRALVDEDECRARYSQTDLEKMLDTMEGIQTTADELDSRRFSCTYVTELRSTKRRDADLTFRIASDGDTPAAIIKTVANVKDKYPYRPKAVVNEINERIRRHGLILLQDGVDTRTRSKGAKPFNMYLFRLFKSVYSLANDKRYAYNYAMPGENPSYIYSQQAVDLIWDLIRGNPEGIIEQMREATKQGPA